MVYICSPLTAHCSPAAATARRSVAAAKPDSVSPHLNLPGLTSFNDANIIYILDMLSIVMYSALVFLKASARNLMGRLKASRHGD